MADLESEQGTPRAFRERRRGDVNDNSFDPVKLQRALPEAVVGEIRSITPIRMGLSGAGVYAVTSTNGEYILRIQGEGANDDFWSQHLLILRRAAEYGAAPPVVHVDEGARAIVSARISGVPLPAVLADPAQRQVAIADVIARLRSLHTIDPSGIDERNALDYARSVWNVQRNRAGFPAWAADTGSVFDRLEAVLARDTRRVVSHNDVNPGNVLWDGTRSWLVDWEVAGLGHPYYDLAAFVTFLGVDPERGYELLALQEQMSLDDRARATFAALRQLVALAVGYVFLSMVPDLNVFVAPTRDDALTLMQCGAAMRKGELDLETPRGRALFGHAFLRIGTEA
jgi:aminoglycoside phosphotransferase (APT) family kinase protein